MAIVGLRCSWKIWPHVHDTSPPIALLQWKLPSTRPTTDPGKPPMNETPAPAALAPFLSGKFRFWSFVSMVLLVFVHGYTIPPTYLQPWTTPDLPLGLTSFVEYLLANGLLRFRIPMLFAISGFLFAMHDAQSHQQRMKKRVGSLLLPYILWSGIHLVILYLMEMNPTLRSWVFAHGIAAMSEQKQLVHDYQWNDVLICWLLAPVPYQLWFIRVLFIYNLAYPLLAGWVTGRTSCKVFFTVAVLLWLVSLNVFFFEGEGLLFFGLGIWIQKTAFNLASPGRWLRPGPWVSTVSQRDGTLGLFDQDTRWTDGLLHQAT